MQDIFFRWIDLLASILFGWQEQRRAQRSLLVTREADRFVISRREKDQDVVVANVPIGSGTSGQWQEARNRLTTFALPAEELVAQHISVPAQARDFVPGIIRNQIDRLSPWPRDQIAYGFDASPGADDPATLDVCVLITSRQAVDAAQAELAASGLVLDRIAGRLPEMPDTFVTLWSRVGDASQERLKSGRRLVATSIASGVVLSALISVWAFMSASDIGDETDALATRIATLERSIRGTSGPSAAGAHNPVQRAWIDKANSRSAVLALETVSKALPDAAHLTEFGLDNATLHLSGLADDVPSLIAPLERSGALTEVHFFAPTTRGPDGALFWFHIEARLKPQSEPGKE
ncbi:MAG TPA: PilN domain-containing protein [Pseudolabrys sp.]|jgi:general secretion pathway protein L|nr:PilN domain-containing protein [Pseudolabrys sp.]